MKSPNHAYAKQRIAEILDWQRTAKRINITVYIGPGGPAIHNAKAGYCWPVPATVAHRMIGIKNLVAVQKLDDGSLIFAKPAE